MRLRPRRRNPLALLLLAALSPMAAHAAVPAVAEDPGTSVAAGVPVTVEIWNADPETKLSLVLANATFVGAVRPVGDSAPVLAGVDLDGSRLTFAVPPDTLPDGTWSTVRFEVGLELEGGAGGTVDAEAPVVVVLRSPYGTPVLQEGSFSFGAPNPPPTCALGGCGAGAQQCPDDSHGKPRQCYGYMGNEYCCVDSPY